MQKLTERGRLDPTFFCSDVLGIKLWKKQREILQSVKENARTTVRSCNGAGKSFVSSAAVAWFLSCHPESIVITTAPTARQVEAILWQEIAKRYHGARIPLGGRLLNTSWTVGPGWFALGLSTNQPDRFQGFHAENILGVIDEAAGVDAPIFEAMDAILTSHGARLLLIGNPTEPSGAFYDSHRSELYNKIHISAFDTPNFTEGRIVYPHLVTPQWVEDRKIIWGEDSPAYSARVKGEFPLVASDTLIPLMWIMNAVERGVSDDPSGYCVMGFDVARFGDDESVIAIRRGNDLTKMLCFNGLDVVEAAAYGMRIADEENPDAIAVDVTGTGSGVADIMRHKGYKVLDVVSNSKAFRRDKFVNKRAEMWFTVREMLRKGTLNIPDDDVLIGQLSSPKYKFDSKGRYLMERKEDMKKRGLSSPDRADALILSCAIDKDYASFIIKDEDESRSKPGTVAAIYDILEAQYKAEEETAWLRGW